MDWGGQEIPPGKYTLKMNEKELKRKKQTPTTSLQLSQLPQNTTFSRNKGFHNNGGCCGWSEPSMRNYNKLYAAIKNKRKKSAPTLSQELLKVFQSRQKKDSGWGTKQLFDQKKCKSPMQMHWLVWQHWWLCLQYGNWQHVQVRHHHLWSKILSTITLKLLIVMWNRMQ